MSFSDDVLYSKGLLADVNSTCYKHSSQNNNTISFDLNDVHVPDVLTLNVIVVFCLVVQGCIMMPIIVGNILIIISVIKFSFLRKPCNILIASLALSDLLVGIVAIPYDFAFYLSYSLKRMRLPCLFRHFIWILCLGSSISNLVLISVERFMAVVFPLKHQIYMTVQKSVIAAVITWLAVLLPCSTVLAGTDTWIPKYGCMFHHTFKKGFTRFASIWMISQVTFSALVFVWVIVVTRKRVNRALLANQSTQHEKNEQGKAKLVALVYGLFVLFWSPSMAYGLSTTMSSQYSEDKYGKLMILIGTCNSCVNIFVYGYKKQSFKVAFKRMIRFCVPKQDHGHLNQPSSSSHGQTSQSVMEFTSCAQLSTPISPYLGRTRCGTAHSTERD